MELRSGRAAATIDLAGGRVATLRVDDLELLVTEGDKPTRWGSFPMVPWVGRLAHGLLHHDGNTWEFPITSPPHANHGLALRVEWQPVDSQTIAVDLGEPWPFGGRVVQRFELTDDAFTVHMTIEAGEQPMPAQLGWHPWFRRSLTRGSELELSFRAESIFETDDDQIPTGNLIPAPGGPWDDTFLGMASGPRLRWPGALELEMSSSFDHWVIFTRPAHAVAVEPQSGAPNDLNRAPQIVDPGEPMSGWMRLDWSTGARSDAE